MITLDSASGYIKIPKAKTYEELLNSIKQTLQINDELCKYLYFSYIDPEEEERIRLIPQIYDDFINQESPMLSIGFLDNVDNKILEKFNDIIDLNKKRFNSEKLQIYEEYLKEPEQESFEELEIKEEKKEKEEEEEKEEKLIIIQENIIKKEEEKEDEKSKSIILAPFNSYNGEKQEEG